MVAVVVYGYGSVVVYGHGLGVVYGYGFGAVVVDGRGDDDGAVAADEDAISVLAALHPLRQAMAKPKDNNL